MMSQTNTMVINLINITSTNIMAKEGIGTVQMALVGRVPEYHSVHPEDINTFLYLKYTPGFGDRITRLPGITISSIPLVIPQIQ